MQRKNSGAKTKVARSRAPILYSTLDISWVSNSEAINPIAMPAIARMSPWRKTRRRMSACSAPRARRMPVMPPLRHRIRQHSVDSDHRERQRSGGKSAEQQHGKAWLRARAIHEFFDGLNVGDWLVRVHHGDLSPHR